MRATIKPTQLLTAVDRAAGSVNFGRELASPSKTPRAEKLELVELASGFEIRRTWNQGYEALASGLTDREALLFLQGMTAGADLIGRIALKLPKGAL